MILLIYCVCVFVCTLCTCMHMCICICIHLCVCMCMRTCVYVWTHCACVCMCMHMCICVHMFVCVCASVHNVCVRVHVCICLHMCVCTHLCDGQLINWPSSLSFHHVAPGNITHALWFGDRHIHPSEVVLRDPLSIGLFLYFLFLQIFFLFIVSIARYIFSPPLPFSLLPFSPLLWQDSHTPSFHLLIATWLGCRTYGVIYDDSVK